MDSISFFWSFVKMLFSLAVVIGLMVGALLMVKRYFYRTPAVADGTTVIRVVASHHLGPKSSLVLVDVLGQVVLLGVSGQQIANLAAITDPAARERLDRLRPPEALSGPADPFARCRTLLRGIGQGRKER